MKANLFCSNFAKLTFCAILCIMYFSSALINDLIDYATLKGQKATTLNKKYAHLLEDKQIDYKTAVAVLNYFGRLLQDDNLGLHLGEKISLKITAYVNSIMQYSETLEDAFDNAVKYSRQISDSLESKLLKKENDYTLIFEESPDWKVNQAYAKKQILDLTLLSALKSITTYTNKKYSPVQVNFEYPKPKNTNEYYRLFNCRLKFNQPKNEIVFEKRIFKRHSKKIEHDLLESLIRKITSEIDNLTPDNETIYQLKKCILNYKPERLSIERAAEEMLLSKRTLQRKLKGLDTTFKKVEHALLLNLSKTYLEEKQKSLEEISYLLGFSENSAFIRFFKVQTKQTPHAYRNESF